MYIPNEDTVPVPFTYTGTVQVKVKLIDKDDGMPFSLRIITFLSQSADESKPITGMIGGLCSQSGRRSLGNQRRGLNGTCFFLFNPLIYERYRRARGGERGEGPFIKIII